MLLLSFLREEWKKNVCIKDENRCPPCVAQRESYIGPPANDDSQEKAYIVH